MKDYGRIRWRSVRNRTLIGVRVLEAIRRGRARLIGSTTNVAMTCYVVTTTPSTISIALSTSGAER